MKPRALGLTLAAALGLTGLSLPGAAAAASGSGSPAAPLIHHFPLGTQTLSHTATAAGGGAAAGAGGGSATTPHRASTATPPRRQAAPTARPPGAHGVSSVLFLLAIPALIVVALLSRVAIQRSRRAARPRARVKRRPDRILRSAASGTRWAFEEKDELDRTQPPLPIRSRRE